MALDALLRKRLAGTRDEEAFELNIHLTAEPGVTVLLGPSGSGKTSTLNCLGGFMKPDSGRILLNDKLLFDAAAKVDLPPEKRRCGYIFQDHALFPHMSVQDNLLFAAQSSTMASGLGRRRQIKELLDSFELTDLAARKPAQLSGGQKQRAALARILINAPRLLLLDEPTRGLDARLRESFYQLLQETQKRLEIPVLLITHDVEECLRVADSISLLEQGCLLQSGTRQAVVEKPASAEVARALGIFNLLPAEIVALDPAKRTSCLRIASTEPQNLGPNDAEIDGPHLPRHLLGDRGTVCFRESEIEVFPLENSSSSRTLVATVLNASACSGGVRLKFSDHLHATVPQSKWESLRRSERLRVSIPPTALHFFG